MLFQFKKMMLALVVVGGSAEAEVRLSVACRCLAVFVRFVLFDIVDVVVSRAPLSWRRNCKF
jgi:hypothetical protein